MKILLRLNGWEKVVDIARNLVWSGSVKIPIFPPMETLCLKGSIVAHNDEVKIVRFVNAERKKNGLYVFENG